VFVYNGVLLLIEYHELTLDDLYFGYLDLQPSLGGWSLSDPFPAMSANEESRTNFVNKCIELVEDYDFDG
jgi:GH18 family chitinase